MSGRTQPLGWTDKEVKMDKRITEQCWMCSKPVKVSADNNNIYTRICTPCKATIPNESPKFYFTVTKSGKVRDR
jgi:hypothetical protein